MAYIVEIQPDERVILDVDYRRKSRSESLRFVVTDQALFVPAVRFQIAGDPHYLKRVPLEQVHEIKVEAIQPYGAYFFSLIMVAIGLVTLWSFLGPDARITPRGLGAGLAIVVGGILLPKVAKGRHRLVLTMTEGTFKWTPPSVVDSPSKREIGDILARIVDACESVRIPAVDDRRAA